ncbi:MAG: acylphosphatase, partial [Wolinella sp.]
MVSSIKKQAKITISGIVQGVGFRPFVYNLATELGVGGYVLNNPQGVLIVAETDQNTLEEFIQAIRQNKPRNAKIDSFKVESDEKLVGYTSFEIRDSVIMGGKCAILPADTSICPDCLREMHDPKDRRYLYPFINCTNCGPRYTIIKELPYDRPKTSMAAFEMCPECQKEYNDPASRRFHAEPNSC